MGDDTRQEGAPARQLGLFDLPHDLLDLIIRPPRGSVDVASAIRLACTCKVASSIVLPRVYRTPLVKSLGTLPKLLQAVSKCSDLAAHVREVLAGSDLGFAPEQFDRISGALRSSKLTSDSALTSIDAALARCGAQALQAMPMLWLSRIATACPNLVSVNLAAYSRRSTPSGVMFGFLNLAAILRERGGRFVSIGRMVPITVVLVREPGNMVLEGGVGHCQPFMLAELPNVVPYFVSTIDWGRKEIEIANGPSNWIAPLMWLVPFCDVVSQDRVEQAKWRITQVKSCSVDSGVGGEKRVGGPIVQAKHDAWTQYGVRMDDDHVFTLDHRCLKSVHVWAKSLDSLDAWMSTHDMLVPKSCGSATICSTNAFSPHLLARPQSQTLIERTMYSLQRLPGQPWVALKYLSFVNGLLFNTGNVRLIFSALATGAPNLVTLGIHNLAMVPQAVLQPLDILVRRPTNPLASLFLTFKQYSLASVQSEGMTVGQERETSAMHPRSMLSSTRATRGHLRQFHLTCVDAGSNGFPALVSTVLIHPGLLHGIRLLFLSGVHFAISPPHFAHPTAPSFTFPDDAAFSHPAPLLQLAHVTLPRLTHLEINSNCLPMTEPDPHSHLPHAPNLVTLKYSDVPMIEPLSAQSIVSMLAKYPSLRTATIAKAQLTRDDVEEGLLRPLFAPWPPELRPCPRLHQLAVHNLAHPTDSAMIGSIVVGPHALDVLPNPEDYVELLKSSAELRVIMTTDASSSVRLQDGEASCTKCGLISPPHRRHIDQEVALGWTMRMLLSRQGFQAASGRAVQRDVVDIGLVERCVRCGQGKMERFYENKKMGEGHTSAWLKR